MSANVETMFYVRETPWHGLGTRVEKALTSEEAIEKAGLGWTVEGRPIYDQFGNVIKGYVANTRNTDNKVLGVVGAQYTRLQNAEGFSFTDNLVGEGLLYDTAGSLRGGKIVWLLGKMPERYILGDKVEPYICFTNNHDGSGAIRVCMTPIRVVCNNTLNLALSEAKRKWSTVHRGNISARLEQAKETLQLADQYLVRLDEKADQLANEKMTEGDIHKALNEMFPLADDATDRQKKTVEDAKNEIVVCMLRPDIAQFLYTKWGFINAVSDYIGHTEPARHTQTYDENRWRKIIGGHQLLDRAMTAVA